MQAATIHTLKRSVVGRSASYPASGCGASVVTGLFLSNENTIGLAIDVLVLVLREAAVDQK